jgi:site-specific DNA recombinase
MPAQQVEDFVVEQIRCVGRDPAQVQETVAQVRQQDQERLVELDAERRSLEKDLKRWNDELAVLSGQLATSADPAGVISRLADLQNCLGMAQRRLAGVHEQVQATRRGLIHQDEVALALGRFDPVWESLAPREQARLIGLLVERIDYDGSKGTLAVSFHAAGIKTLADELAGQEQEKSA